MALVLSACGGSTPAAAPTAEPPAPSAPAAAAPSSVPTVARAAAPSPAATTGSSAANPTSTTGAAAAATTTQNTVWVGNTDGEGVYLRKTPVMADRLNAYADGTPLTIVGDDVDGDGQHWKHVKAPDGTEGYVPATYTVDTQP